MFQAIYSRNQIRILSSGSRWVGKVASFSIPLNLDLLFFELFDCEE